jgi:hypothetical protein
LKSIGTTAKNKNLAYSDRGELPFEEELPVKDKVNYLLTMGEESLDPFHLYWLPKILTR